MKNIYCLNKISKVGLDNLTKEYSVTEDINSADALLVRSANMHELDLPETVKAVARCGAGVNNVPLDTYAQKGIVVFNTPGANANAVKELIIAMMLLASRDINGGIKWVQSNREDEQINKSMEKVKSQFAGNEIFGKTLGIIGLGAIGSLLAGAASGLGMKVIAVEPSIKTIERNRHLLPKDIKIVDHETLYKCADFISINVPLCEGTRKMINKNAFDLMKPGVIIINAARDLIVDDEDLKIAIEEGKVRKYVTDFPNYTTNNMDGVLALPHLGASTVEAEDNCAVMAVNQIMDYLENGNISNSVNFPNISLGKKNNSKRVILLLQNSVDLEDQLLTKLSEIAEIYDHRFATKDSYAAMIVDLSITSCVSLEDHLKTNPNIIRVRVI